MASLTGNQIKDTYQGLLKTTDNDVLGASAKVITDGAGNPSGLSLDTNGNVAVSGDLSVGDELSVTGAVTLTDSITASSFVKTGGTSSQFLKANGSVDGTVYATEADLTTAEGRISVNEGDIVAIEAKTDYITVTQAVNLDTMESGIATNTANIATNASNISANTSAISSNDSDISALQSGKVAKTGDTMTGNLTSTGFVKSGGTSAQFLKADGSIDSNAYITAESDTLDSVTDRGAVTTNTVTVGDFNAQASSLNSLSVVTTSSFTGDAAFDTDTLFVDVSADSVGINTNTPTEALDVVGNIKASGSITGGSLVGNLTGNVSGNVTGNVSGNLTGSVLTAAQTNITSVGTLSSLAVGGDVTIADKIVHSGDTNTSIRFLTNDTVTIETNGEERVRVDVNGNLGVGDSDPLIFAGYRNVSVKGGSGGFYHSKNSDGTYHGFFGMDSAAGFLKITSFSNHDAVISTNNTERARFDSGGDVSFRDSSANEAFYWDASAASLGIGLSSINPAVKLQVEGVIASSGANSKIFADNLENWGNNLVLNSAGGLSTIFQTNGSERMRIDSSGYVGIGIQTPVLKLDTVASVTGAYSSSTQQAVARFFNKTNDGTASSAFLSLQVSSDNEASNPVARIGVVAESAGSNNGAFVVATRDGLGVTERMRITSGGYLKASNGGAYISSSATYHELQQTANDNYIAVFSNSGSPAPYGISIAFTGAAPNNSSSTFISAGDTSAARFIVNSNGGIANYQANDINLSDERVKTDISPLGSYWDKIKAIEIVNFKYIDQTHDDFNIGVIAQQVESIAPEFVDVDGFDKKPKLISEEVLDEEGNVIEEAVYEEPLAEPLKAVYTADLYHAAIKVLQEAMARIEVLETELNALKQS